MQLLKKQAISLFSLSYLTLALISLYNLKKVNCNFYNDFLFCNNTPSFNIKILNFVVLLIIFLTISICYYFIIKNKNFSIPWITLILLFSFLTLPFGTTDIYYYRGVAKGELEKNINPYKGGFEKNIEQLNLYNQKLSTPVMYPPLWLQTNKLIYSLSPNNEILSIYIYKLFATIIFIFTGLLVYKFFGKYYSKLFLLNPLFLFEFVTNAHLDVYLIFLIVLAIIAFSKNKQFTPYYLIFLASLIKFNAILILPFFIFYFYNKQKNIYKKISSLLVAICATIFGFITYALMYKPYWFGPKTLMGISDQSAWSYNTIFERLTFTPLNPTYHIFKEYNGKTFFYFWALLILVGTAIFLYFFYKKTLNKYAAIELIKLKIKLSKNDIYYYIGLFNLIFVIFFMRSFLPWYLTWSSIFFIFTKFKNREVILFLQTLILAIYYPTIYLIGHFNYIHNSIIYVFLIICELILFIFIGLILNAKPTSKS